MGLELVLPKTAKIKVLRRADGRWLHAGDLEMFFRETAKVALREGSDVTAVAFEVSADEIKSIAKDAA